MSLVRLHRGPFFIAPASPEEDRADFEGPPTCPYWIVCNAEGLNVLGCLHSMEQAARAATEMSP